MPEKLKLSTSKKLRINNAVIIPIDDTDYFDVEKTVGIMENYIKSKACQPIGPLIQWTQSIIDDEGRPVVKGFVIRQSSNFIHHVEPPFSMVSVIRVDPCLYVRFHDTEFKLKYAYDKLGLYSYEENIELSGNTYTVFVDQNDEMLTVDVFMEIKHD